MKRLIILLALAVITLNGCLVVPEHHHRDNEGYENNHGDERGDHHDHHRHDNRDDEHGDH